MWAHQSQAAHCMRNGTTHIASSHLINGLCILAKLGATANRLAQGSTAGGVWHGLGLRPAGQVARNNQAGHSEASTHHVHASKVAARLLVQRTNDIGPVEQQQEKVAA